MKTYMIIGSVLLILFLFFSSLAIGQKIDVCHQMMSYNISYYLSLPPNEIEVRCVPFPYDEIIVRDIGSVKKIRLAKGKLNLIYKGKEKGWILIQEFLKPNINDSQNDQTVMREFLKREQANQNPTFSITKVNKCKGYKAVSGKVNDPLKATIVLFWLNDVTEIKTRCVIYSEFDSKYTEELLGSFQIKHKIETR